MAYEVHRKKQTILFLKTQNVNDNYEKLFTEKNYFPVFIPVLSFDFINQNELRERLRHPQNCSGLIFTSQRAVEAVDICVKDANFIEEWSPDLHEKWSKIPVFVTGKATGKYARENLKFETIVGEESGCAEELANIIVNKLTASDEGKELLFPCANIKKETLPNIVMEKGFKICCITAYCTKPHPDIIENIQKLFCAERDLSELDASGKTAGNPSGKTVVRSQKPVCIVFFSPSGVNFAGEALRKHLKTFNESKLVAIGKSTAKELDKHKLFVSGTSQKPNPESLLQVISSILE